MSVIYAVRQKYVEQITQTYHTGLSKVSYGAKIQLIMPEKLHG
jgi:hypothetical protein